jgi:hypothetical protein
MLAATKPAHDRSVKTKPTAMRGFAILGMRGVFMQISVHLGSFGIEFAFFTE